MDTKAIITQAKNNSAISSEIVDDILLPLADKIKKYSGSFGMKLKPYTKTLRKMPNGFANFLLSEYIAYQIFRKNGFGSSLLHHRLVLERSEEEIDFLTRTLETPWRFTFFWISAEEGEDLYRAVDLFTGEPFLFFSKGVTDIQGEKGKKLIFFALIGCTDGCWQSYGINSYFVGLREKDILGFTQAMKPAVRSLAEIPAVIAENPVPFMMLFELGESPTTAHHTEEMLFCLTELPMPTFPSLAELETEFEVKVKNGVYALSLDESWQKFPHSPECYYDSKKKFFQILVGTERVYREYMVHFEKLGMTIPEPQRTCGTLGMMAITTILEKPFKTGNYGKLFTIPATPEQKKEMEKMNLCMGKMMELEKGNMKYNTKELAQEFDLAIETVDQLRDVFRDKKSQQKK